MKYILAILVSSSFLLSCNNLTCGELTGEWKEQYEKANSVAVDLKVENIPCEYFYINVILKTKVVDTSAIHSIHRYLYNEKNKIGWQVLQVYDVNGKYIFSHKYNDNIYIQTGD
jgi:hypothetical protein